jgi:hypothetical protein
LSSQNSARKLITISIGILIILLIPVGVLFINNRPPQINIPTHKLPKPNAWDGFVRAGAMAPKPPYSGPISRADKDVSAWTVADYRSDYPVFMKHSGTALAELKVALGQPYMHPPVRTPNDPANVFPSFARMRELARISSSRALYENALGRPGTAMDSLLDVLDLGVTLPKGGPMFGELVGAAVETIGVFHIEKTDILDKLDAKQLADAAQRVDAIAAKRVSIGDVLDEEAYSTASSYLEGFQGPGRGDSLMNPLGWIEAGSSFGGTSKLESFWIGTQIAFANKSAVVREEMDYFKALAAEQSRGYTGKSSVPEPRNLFARATGATGINPPMFTVIHARAETNMELLRTEIALRRFKLDHGSYPKSLSELSPKYLTKKPIDPFGLKKPLCYKLTKGGKSFLLYSRGPDMTDDGGKVAKFEGVTTKGDLFFGAKQSLSEKRNL